VVTLAEDLLLLSCDGATGRTLIDTTHLDLGLGGALLLDLARHRRVALVAGRVTVTDTTGTGERLLDTALAAVTEEGGAHDPEHWVRHLARGARRAVQDRLLATGVLRHDEHRVLGLIPVHRTHEADGRLHHELLDHLHDTVVRGHPASAQTAALVSLALAVGLDRHLFPRSDRHAVRDRMAEIVQGRPTEQRWAVDAVAHCVDVVNATLGIAPPF
jgi:hypothetical protein